MIKRIIVILIWILCVCSIAHSESRKFKHENSLLNTELNNIYYLIDYNNFFLLRTTAELQAIAPSRIGEYYFNTDTYDLWVATGTDVNDFVQYENK